MDNYQHREAYTDAADFATDESFQLYVLGSDTHATKYWNTYCRKHPAKLKEIVVAKELISMLQVSEIQPARTTSSRRLWPVILAMIILVVLAGFIWLSPKNKSIPELAFYQAAETLEIDIEDDSRVILREGARLTRTLEMSTDQPRQYWLEGEAYFDIATSTGADGKCLVTLPVGSIEVTGTRFLVKSDANQSQILLEEGQVIYRYSDDQYILKQGQLLSFDGNRLRIDNDQDVDQYKSWSLDRLSLDQLPISELVDMLRSSYGLEILVQNEILLQRKITASVRKNDPLLLLKAIDELYDDIKIIYDNDQITIL